MPSTTPPSANDDYVAPPEGLSLTRTVWNAVFASISSRLRAVEATASDMQAVIDAGTSAALTYIQTNVQSALDVVQGTINDLNAQLAEAQDKLAAIIVGGIDAASVAVSGIAGLVATTSQAAFAELLGKITTNTSAISTNTTAIANNATAIAAIRNVTFVAVTGNTALVAGKAYRVKAAATLTLPGSPATGDTIRITDGEVIASGAAVVVARNGNTIMGASSDLTIDSQGADVLIWWNGTDWRLF